MTITRWLLALAVLLGVHSPVNAEVVTFDELTTRQDFYSLGISDTYFGFRWGHSTTPGLDEAAVPTKTKIGWASATVGDPAWSPAPAPVSGSSYAWNWSGPQSLIIDFQTAHDVAGAYFATLSSGYYQNASSIQLFGYDASFNFVGSSSALSLSNTFQFLSAGLSGINYLEIRADANDRWFSIDDLDVSATPAPVPEPATITLVGSVLAAVALRARQRRRVHPAVD